MNLTEQTRSFAHFFLVMDMECTTEISASFVTPIYKPHLFWSDFGLKIRSAAYLRDHHKFGPLVVLSGD